MATWVAQNVRLGWIVALGTLLTLVVCPLFTVMLLVYAGATGALLGAVETVLVAWTVAQLCDARIKHVERLERLGPLAL